MLSTAGGFALVGLLEFLAGDINSVITISLANGHGDTGALVLVNYEYLVFTAVASVLPIAIVTSVFPVLSAAGGDAFDRTCAGSARAVVLMALLGTAVIAAVAVPVAHILTKEPDQVTQLAQAELLICAPGVVGYAVIVHMSRVLFALGKLKIAGIGLVAGPRLQSVLAFPLVLLAPGPPGRGRDRARYHHRLGRRRDPDGDRDKAAAGAGRRGRPWPRELRPGSPRPPRAPPRAWAVNLIAPERRKDRERRRATAHSPRGGSRSSSSASWRTRSTVATCAPWRAGGCAGSPGARGRADHGRRAPAGYGDTAGRGQGQADGGLADQAVVGRS